LNALSPALEFERAAEIYASIRTVSLTPGALTARYLRLNTEKAFHSQVKSILLFFPATKLEDIGWWNMKEYQAARVAGAAPWFVRYRRPQDAKPRRLKGGQVLPPVGKTPCPAKPQQVNQEMQLLKRLKKLAGCWTAEDQRWFQYLPEEDSGEERALTPEEQALWVDMCRARERWEVILWYSLLAFHTAASTNELRGLRLGDVSLPQELIKIPWPCAKNKYRRRTITIDDPEAHWALQQLLDRAHMLGSIDPMHYLFPAWDPRANCYVPDRPMSGSGLKKKWQEVREATGLLWFTAYGTRHTAATRMAENGVPVDVIMARMGHVQEEMRQHYTHISQAAQRRWFRNTPPGGHGPKRVGSDEAERAAAHHLQRRYAER
jgi:integrase